MPQLGYSPCPYAPGAVLAKIEPGDFPAGMESALRGGGSGNGEERQGGKARDQHDGRSHKEPPKDSAI